MGPLEVRAGSDVVSIRHGLPRALLIALLLRTGQSVSASFLIDVLWGDDLPRNPANALQIQVSYLRKQLAGGASDGTAPLETRPGGYSLVAEPAAIDVFRFEAAMRDLPPPDTLLDELAVRHALDHVDAALEMWRGQALEDVATMDFARGEITRLEELRSAALERRMDLLLLLGRHNDVVSDLSELVRRMPLRERFREQLVLALYRAGRQGDALRAFDDARRTLVDELGIDPGPELRRLERRVLEQDPSLDWAPITKVRAAERPTVGPTGSAPPPRGTGRLPVPLSSLVGRSAELARLADVLDRHRALTLTGPAGAGKTRLAIELASRSSLPVCYVDFSPIDDPKLVGPTVASAAGVTASSPGEDPVASIAATLAPLEMLVVLDTCEHVAGAVAQLASVVLGAAPGVRMLATSRRTLGLSGEFAWPVPPLDLPPPDAATLAEIAPHAAVALFLERATAVRPDLDVDDAMAADIAAICVALDGLPLAIELAAVRSEALSHEAIRARLEDRFALLIDGSSDATQRQQTLRAAIDWSYELLAPGQRRFFARLGVFAGTFDLEAALDVAGPGLDAPVDLLASLVKQSMVARAGRDRYRLLDTLRAYALEALAQLDADDTRKRHATVYVALAEQGEMGIRGAGQHAWLEHLRGDINNFRAALEWCLMTGDTTSAGRLGGALAWFWTLNGMLAEAIQQLEQLVAIEDMSPATRAKCLWGYALLSASLGRLGTARDAGGRAVDLARSCGDDAGAAYGLNAVAVAEWALGNHDRSLDAHREALALLDTLDDPWGQAVCNVLQARTLFDIGDRDAAAVAREGVDHARRAGDAHVLGIALTQIAQIAIADGNTGAKAAAAEALDLQEAIGYTEGMVSALHVLGQAHRIAGDLDAARAHHRRALALAARIGHAAAMCEAIEDLARDESTQHPELANRLLGASRAERERRGLPLRQRDAADLARLEVAFAGSPAEHDERAFADLVAELVG